MGVYLCVNIVIHVCLFVSLQKRIKDHKYRSLEDLEEDINTLCQNAQDYNVEGSVVCCTLSEPHHVQVCLWGQWRPILMALLNYLSQCMTKPTKRMCAQGRQISLGIHLVWSESSLCAQWVVKDQAFFMRWQRLGGCHFVGFVMRWLIYVYQNLLPFCVNLAIMQASLHSNQRPSLYTFKNHFLLPNMPVHNIGPFQTRGRHRLVTAITIHNGLLPWTSCDVLVVMSSGILYKKKKCPGIPPILYQWGLPNLIYAYIYWTRHVTYQMTKVSLYDLYFDLIYFIQKNISVLYSLGIPLCYVGTSVGDEPNCI